MWGGFFMVIPLIAVHYVENLGWAAAAIGRMGEAAGNHQVAITGPDGVPVRLMGTRYVSVSSNWEKPGNRPHHSWTEVCGQMNCRPGTNTSAQTSERDERSSTR
jgi:hypothetical protein